MKRSQDEDSRPKQIDRKKKQKMAEDGDEDAANPNPNPNPPSTGEKLKLQSEREDLQRRILEKKAALANKDAIMQKIMAAKLKKAEREAAEKAQEEFHSTIQEVHDEQVKAKGGLNVAYHPALSMSLDPKARISKNRNDFLIPKHATTMLNQKVANEAKPQQSLVKKKEIILEDVVFPDPSKNAYYDPSLKAQSGYQPQKRNRSTFKFNEPGKFIDQGNQLRKQQELDRLKQEIAEAARKAGMERDLALVSNQGLRKDLPPPVEWWDAKLLPGESYEEVIVAQLADELGEMINSIVQHPVPIEPPLEEGVVVPIKPLLLTKMERKKLRRQNRLETQRERQDKIKLGLLPQDQPRITKSNFMRVLGQEAVLAPSMVEKEMARQVAERQEKHLQKIADEKLTDEQRRAKKDRKLEEDTSLLVHVAVFKITNLEHKQHLFKISKNAQQYKLTGVLILNSVMNLLIVEGGPKGIGAYKRLMANRINWQDRPQDAAPLAEPNRCNLVWEGQVKTRSFFHNFKTKRFESIDEAKEFLEGKGVVQYWNAARTLVIDTI